MASGANFGVLANYTQVESEIEYTLTSANGVITSSTTNDLVDLSPNSASGTLFYDDGTLQHPLHRFVPKTRSTTRLAARPSLSEQ